MSVVADASSPPLTPTDCDLRGMPFMPLDVIRLLDSDFFALSTGDEFKAALALWCKSWTQVPAGSLPDDDRILAHLSGTGHTAWRDMSRDMILRGWIKCSDGRLYHPVVAEKALEALPRRREYQDRRTSEAERKARERQDRKVLFAALKAAGITCDFNAKTSVLRDLAARHNVTPKVTDDVTPVTDKVTDDVTAKTGTGTGTGTVINTSSEVGAAKRTPRGKRGTRLPEDWELPAEWLAWAAEDRRWSEQRVRAVALGFRDYWWGKAGKDAVKVDWFATFRGWCRREEQGPASVSRSAAIGANLPGNCTPIGSPC